MFKEIPLLVELIFWSIPFGLVIYFGPFYILQGAEKIQKTKARRGLRTLIAGSVTTALTIAFFKLVLTGESQLGESLSLLIEKSFQVSLIALGLHLLSLKKQTS